MKRSINKMYIYIVLCLCVGLLVSLIESRGLDNQKRALLVCHAFPVYSTQLTTMIIMLKKIGYEVFIYAAKRQYSQNDHIANFYAAFNAGDVYNRAYLPDS